MTTADNQLPASAFASSPELRALWSPSSLIRSHWVTSEEIGLTIHKPAKTPNPRKLDSLTVLSVPRDTRMGNWRLKSLLMVQLRRTRRQWVATAWLEGTAEYGTAETVGEAIMDLVDSLGEYLESLEKRADTLGDSAQRELAYLRNLIECVT